MLCSQGVPLAELGVPRADGGPTETDGRRIWRRFAENYHLFRGTPSRLWLDHTFETVFGLDARLSAATADALLRPHRRLPGAARVPPPRALRALQHRGDRHHRQRARRPALAPDDPRLRAGTAGWSPPTAPTRWSIPSSRASPRTSPASARSPAATPRPGQGYLEAHRKRRAFFKEFGATSTDHGHPTARTEDLPQAEAAALFAKALAGKATPGGGRRLPRPDADRDGADEPRRRPGAADPPRLLAQPLGRRSSPASAATRASTSPPAPTSSAR